MCPLAQSRAACEASSPRGRRTACHGHSPCDKAARDRLRHHRRRGPERGRHDRQCPRHGRGPRPQGAPEGRSEPLHPRYRPWRIPPTTHLQNPLVRVALAVLDRWYPSSKTCSSCGWQNPRLKLSDRTFHCDTCTLVIDRDLNAARTQRLGRHRWVVERTVSWLAGCRRLHRRYERKAEHFLAFVGIAAALICHRRLTK
ncbi:zinc ribbon domain-containing protein [Streptomyces sp. NPDC127051]|uniref:zinc ribbon domain-containing protein n=1 Tax=Streptomyces sp. NPDC127051 TaxID=3347119 RepID=UPI00364AB4DC